MRVSLSLIYVADRLAILDDVVGVVYADSSLIDDGKCQVLAVWGKLGRDNSSMNLPTGIAVAPNGDVWVVDSLNNRVLKFAPVR